MIQYKLFNKTSNVYLRHVYPQDKLQRALIYSANNIQEIFDYRTLLLHDTQLAGSILEIHEFNGSEFIRIVEPEDAISSSTIDSIIAKHLNKHAGTIPIPVSNLIYCIKAIIVEYNASINPKVTIPSDLDLAMLENYRLQNELLQLQINAAKPLPALIDYNALSEQEQSDFQAALERNPPKWRDAIYKAKDHTKRVQQILSERVYLKGSILHLVFEIETGTGEESDTNNKTAKVRHDYIQELLEDKKASDIIEIIKKAAGTLSYPNTWATLIFSNIL